MPTAAHVTLGLVSVLNTKVFFWFTRERLLRLLGAGAYRDRRHDVLEIDGSALIGAYEKAIWFCPMNSGCTKPFRTREDQKHFYEFLSIHILGGEAGGNGASE